MTVNDLPILNATLNGITSILLLAGYYFIKKGDEITHRKVMISALTTSTLFLISYLIYHYTVGSVPYPYHDWSRPLYFAILIPHVILAAGMIPFILIAVRHAFKRNFESHKKLMKYVLPVWLFVSITGVLVYLMLYQF